MGGRKIRTIEQRTKIHIARLSFFIILFLFILGSLGPKALVRLSLVSERLKGTKEVAESAASTPILPPKLDPLPEATKEKTVIVTGLAEADAVVEILVNDVRRGKAPVKDDGTFTMEVPLQTGENIITGVARGSNQSESETSKPVTIVYKDKPPEITVEEPREGEKRSVSDRIMVVKGKADSSSVVTIDDRIAVLQPDGSFEHRIELSEGETVVKIIARDNAGNETIIERKILIYP